MCTFLCVGTKDDFRRKLHIWFLQIENITVFFIIFGGFTFLPIYRELSRLGADSRLRLRGLTVQNTSCKKFLIGKIFGKIKVMCIETKNQWTLPFHCIKFSHQLSLLTINLKVDHGIGGKWFDNIWFHQYKLIYAIICLSLVFISHMPTLAVEDYSVVYSAGIDHSHSPIATRDLWQTRNLSVYLITYVNKNGNRPARQKIFKTTIHSKSYANVLRCAVAWIC